MEKQAKTKRPECHLEKVRECQRQDFLKYKEANPEKVKQMEKQAKTKRRECHLEKVKECQRQDFHKYKEANSEKVKQMEKQAKTKRRECHLEKVRECQRQGFKKYKQANPDKVQLPYKRNRACLRNVMDNLQNGINDDDNSHDPGPNKKWAKGAGGVNQFKQETTKQRNVVEDETREQTCHSKECFHNLTMSKLTEMFHRNIKCGPEYVCTCCDQLWYRSSVTKCSPNLYKICPQNIILLCMTGVKSINDSEWICSTCHCNLKDGKLPKCAKANKMTFPDKPEVLNLTVLEERLISPRIPFMQIRELPTGGQLSIHGNVINVPADVNSTVNVLPRPVNESQTIPIKLKRRLSYKHYYQFQSIRPSKVLEAAKYFVRTSKLF